MKPLRDLLREPEGATGRPWIAIECDGPRMLLVKPEDRALVVRAVNLHALLAEVAVAGEDLATVLAIGDGLRQTEPHHPEIARGYALSLQEARVALGEALSSLRAALETEAS